MTDVDPFKKVCSKCKHLIWKTEFKLKKNGKGCSVCKKCCIHQRINDNKFNIPQAVLGTPLCIDKSYPEPEVINDNIYPSDEDTYDEILKRTDSMCDCVIL